MSVKRETVCFSVSLKDYRSFHLLSRETGAPPSGCAAAACPEKILLRSPAGSRQARPVECPLKEKFQAHGFHASGHLRYKPEPGGSPNIPAGRGNRERQLIDPGSFRIIRHGKIHRPRKGSSMIHFRSGAAGREGKVHIPQIGSLPEQTRNLSNALERIT